MSSQWHSTEMSEIWETLGSSHKGLSNELFEEKFVKYGPNELKKKKSVSQVQRFLQQFNDFLIIILLVSVAISFALGEYIDAIAIAIIVMFNAVLGFVQEFRAEQAIEALEAMTAPHARVKRNGKLAIIPSRELVPGDLIEVESGDSIPADARIFKSYVFRVNESGLTGESLPVDKAAISTLPSGTPLADKKNMIFQGTIAVNGRTSAVVCTTGAQTEMGKIATLIAETKSTETPLTIQLKEFGKKIAIIVLIICFIVFLLGFYVGLSSLDFDWDKWPEIAVPMFVVGVSLAVAAIPEGLPAVVTLALAIGVQRMAKQRAVVRKLKAVETLGSTTVICSDKTGTLTTNQMTVKRILLPNKLYTVTGEGYSPKGDILDKDHSVKVTEHPDLKLLVQIGMFCNTSVLEMSQEGDYRIVGDPTEGALSVLGAKVHLEGIWKHLFEAPFDSDRKMMTVVYEKEDGEKIALIKGAPDIFLDQCTKILDGNSVRELTNIDRKNIKERSEELSKQAYRMLALGYKDIDASTLQKLKDAQKPEDILESEIIYVGQVGLVDPARPESAISVQQCRKAGIMPVMITGDHRTTAVAIAKDVGIITNEEEQRVLTGQELEQISDEELRLQVMDTQVYARVSPAHKMRIVTALQKNNQIVAMTGDGVNDAPALKKADIGIAMGKMGTDVAREAAAMILTDDNFATITAAVEEGRGIFDNMKKFIGYLLGCNAAEVMTIFFGILLIAFLSGGKATGVGESTETIVPFLAIQILFMNLVTDGLPALALGIDPPEPNIMERPPRDPEESILSKDMYIKILFSGLIIAIGTLFLFFWQLGLDIDLWEDHLGKAQTTAFIVCIMFQNFMSLTSRSEIHSIFTIKTQNWYLWAAFLLNLFLLFVIVYVPFFHDIFHTVNLDATDWFGIFVISSTILFIDEIRKMIYRMKMVKH